MGSDEWSEGEVGRVEEDLHVWAAGGDGKLDFFWSVEVCVCGFRMEG